MVLVFENPAEVISVARVIGIATLSFIVAFSLTPVLTHYLYKYRDPNLLSPPCQESRNASRRRYYCLGQCFALSHLFLAAVDYLAHRFNPYP